MQMAILGGGRDFAAVKGAGVENVIALPSGDPRHTAREPSRYAFAGWTLDAVTRELLDGAGKSVHLTSLEFDLLVTFVRQPATPLSRAALVSALRGRDWTYFDRSMDTLVARLRKKIEGGRSSSLIRSVRGVGYVFCAAVEEASSPAPSPLATMTA